MYEILNEPCNSVKKTSGYKWDMHIRHLINLLTAVPRIRRQHGSNMINDPPSHQRHAHKPPTAPSKKNKLCATYKIHVISKKCIDNIH